MATAFVRLRMLWGALDFTEAQSSTPMYATTQMVSGGTSAVVGSGVGVRRLSVLLDRTAVEAGMDPAYIHFDILNMTAGSPDDTWITADYTACETAFAAAWGTWASYVTNGVKPTQYIWHRVGTGVGSPNPAERSIVTAALGPGVGGTGMPQQASSITFRTGQRRNWGRTYIPLGNSALTAAGRVSTTVTDAWTTAMLGMVGSLATADMHLVVVSKPLNSSLNVEKVEMDNVPDVIRRRRFKSSTYKKILP